MGLVGIYWGIPPITLYVKNALVRLVSGYAHDFYILHSTVAAYWRAERRGIPHTIIQ